MRFHNFLQPNQNESRPGRLGTKQRQIDKEQVGSKLFASLRETDPTLKINPELRSPRFDEVGVKLGVVPGLGPNCPAFPTQSKTCFRDYNNN